MRAPAHLRLFVLAAALATAALAPGAAVAAEVGVPALNGTFAGNASGWTATSSCAPLCTVGNTVDANAGANDPPSATVLYTSLGGLLGGLATGTSTWTSPAFTWTNATPSNVTLSFARRAAIGGLLNVGGSAGVRIQLRDVTSSTLTTIDTGTIAAAEATFVTHVLTVDPALFRQAHSYRLLITTNLAAAALLSDIRVSYDDVALRAVVDDGTTAGGGDGAGGSGGTGGSDGPGSTPTTSPGGGAKTALRLLAPRSVRFEPGHAVALRVRVTRAGAALRKVVVTLRAGALVRRVSTGRDGYATIRLTRRARSPLRVTFRAGTATATTWLRPASAR